MYVVVVALFVEAGLARVVAAQHASAKTGIQLDHTLYLVEVFVPRLRLARLALVLFEFCLLTC